MSYDYNDIAGMLNFIDSGLPRDEWVKYLMSIKSELDDGGFELANNWSAGADNYNENDFKNAWRSIKSGGRITINYLASRAKKAGWRSDQQRLTDEQKAQRQRDAEVRRQRRQALEAEEEKNTAIWHSVVADCAQALFKQLSTSGVSDYLKIKKVGAFGGIRFFGRGCVLHYDIDKKAIDIIHGKDNIQAFFANKTDETVFHHFKYGAIAIPLYHAEHGLMNLQIITAPSKKNPTGKKLFLRFGRKSACSFAWGLSQSNANPIVICEGYATAASIHMATHWPVVVSFDCGNLIPVAEWIRELYPDTKLIVAGDDDFKTKDNPGREKALRAGNLVGAAVVLPEFAAE